MKVAVTNRAGAIVAVTTVDDLDAELVKGWNWLLMPNGYVYRRGVEQGRKTTLMLHRQILGLAVGDIGWGDHIDGNKMDNRRSNLRIATPQESSQNRRPSPTYAGKRVQSKFRSVYLHRGRWHARCAKGGNRVYLGSFQEEAEAAEVALSWRNEHMPFAVVR